MQIPKDQIIQLLQSMGQQDKVGQAQSELPGQVDTEQHADLLSRLGIDPQQLISQLAGGEGLGGIGKRLGF